MDAERKGEDIRHLMNRDVSASGRMIKTDSKSNFGQTNFENGKQSHHSIRGGYHHSTHTPSQQ